MADKWRLIVQNVAYFIGFRGFFLTKMGRLIKYSRDVMILRFRFGGSIATNGGSLAEL